jgi:glycosyltransferase involved in cell wall biosynthesis
MITLSIIIPCLNEERRLGPTLQALKQQSASADLFEVIIVDGGSSDATVAMAREAGMKVVQCEQGLGRQRNTGAISANAKWLAFMDADCTASPNWVREALQCIAAGNADVLIGPVLVPAGGTWVERAWGTHLEMRHLAAPTTYRIFRFLSTQNFIVCRSAFEKVGRISEHLSSGEDTIFAYSLWKQGFRLAYNDKLIVWHRGEPKSVRDFFTQQIWHSNRDVYQQMGSAGYAGRAFWYGMVNVACMVAFALSVIIGLLIKNALLPATIFLGYLLIPVLLAARTAWITGSIGQAAPLAVLYFIYGLARASYMLRVSELNDKQNWF